MIIERLHVGAHSSTTLYAVCADATETGDKPHEIARFNTLAAAVNVLKYIRGDSLSDNDAYIAKEAIKKAGTSTDQSKRTRKAE